MATTSVNRLRWILAAFSLGGLVAPPAFAQRLRVTPRASQQRPAPGTMTDATPFVFTRAPEGVVQVTSWEPGASLPIATSGGVAPITYTVMAAQRPELFEIIEMRTAAGSPRSAGGSVGRSPSTTTPPSRALRFKGMPRQSSAGYDSGVTITAKDARGTTITRDFILLALPGRVSKLELTDPNIVRSQTTIVRATLDLLPPGARVHVRESTSYLMSIPRAIEQFPCLFGVDFGPAPQATGPSLIADANGRISLPPLAGSFGALDTHKTGPCALGLLLDVTPTGHKLPTPVWTFVTTTPVRISPSMTYRVDRTWALNSKFRFAVNPPMPGSCFGVSAFTGGVFPVGAFEDNNGDLALAVRSGPLGTDCRAESAPWAVPEAFRIKAVDWDLQRTGDKCCIGDACRPSTAPASEGFIVPGAIPSDDVNIYRTGSREDPLKDATNRSAGSNPSRRYYDVFNSMQARLTCKETSSNDHGVKATLKSVTFEGPPGKIFP